LSSLAKSQTFIILIAIALGLLIGQSEAIGTFSSHLITPLLVAMLLGVFVSLPLNTIKELEKSFKNLKFVSISLIVNFIWIPILGFILGEIFLKSSIDLKIGYLMLLVTPCTDWYLVFTDLAKGNVPLSTSLLPINLIAQLLLLPVYLYIFAGLAGTVDTGSLVKSVILILVIPFGLSLSLKRWFKEESFIRVAVNRIFERGVFIFLALAIVCMFASEARRFWGNFTQFKLLCPPVILFFVINFFVGRLVSRLAHFSRADSVSLSMTTLARNSPLALAVAVVAFPRQPLIALALVFGPLIEIPVLFIVAKTLRWLGRNEAA
jgi:ACR3 family arsenite efflux pump ArsB